MLGFSSGELVIIAVLALVVIGPKDLPRVLRVLGRYTAKGRDMARTFRAGFDTMMREAELDELREVGNLNTVMTQSAPATHDAEPAKPTAEEPVVQP